MNASAPTVSLGLPALITDCADLAALADFCGKAMDGPVSPRIEKESS